MENNIQITAATLAHAIAATPARSAWDKGVKYYAGMILADVDDVSGTNEQLEARLLNGAENWKQYSEGGCALIYDENIAETLCTQSELKKTHGGKLQPNNWESWLDVQTRALRQAFLLICDVRDKQAA